MNIAEWSIRNKVITWVLTLLMVVLGYQSFFALSWLEDPEFTIKDAVYLTRSDKRWDGVRKDMVFEFEPEYRWIQLVLQKKK